MGLSRFEYKFIIADIFDYKIRLRAMPQCASQFLVLAIQNCLFYFTEGQFIYG
jgi:hypothetical protein